VIAQGIPRPAPIQAQPPVDGKAKLLHQPLARRRLRTFTDLNLSGVNVRQHLGAATEAASPSISIRGPASALLRFVPVS
jgi:hypothetical protein